MVSSTSRAPVLSPMSPWAVKWTAAGADVVGEEGPAGEDDPDVPGGALAGGPDVPGETGVSDDGGGGGPCWQAVSSSPSMSTSASESTAGATRDHLCCFNSPGMIPHITEPSLMPLQAGNGIYC